MPRHSRRRGNHITVASVAIIVTLSRIGAAAGAANRCSAFKIPPHNVTSVMSRRYGKVIRVSDTASAN